MLSSLKISNFALIDHMDLEFSKGFNVITGETGASKTIILEAANFLTGGRASLNIIKTGKAEAFVEGFFEGKFIDHINPLLDEMGINLDENIIIKRIIKKNGSNRIFINGSNVNLSTLEKIGKYLIDYSGQFEHQHLLKAENQLKLLDSLSGCDDLLNEHLCLFLKLKEADEKIQNLLNMESKRQEQISFLSFRLSELEKIDLSAEAEEQINERFKVIRNSKTLNEDIEFCDNLIYSKDDSMISQLSSLEEKISYLSEFFPSLSVYKKDFESFSESANEFVRELWALKESVTFDESELIEIEEKLSQIFEIKRKYAMDLDEIAREKETMEAQLNELKNYEHNLKESFFEYNKAFDKLLEVSNKLSIKRQKKSKIISKMISSELEKLGIVKNSFSIELIEVSKEIKGKYNTATFSNEKPIKLTKNGKEKASFIFAPNPGQEGKLLNQIISGGELSRVLLAIKAVQNQDTKYLTKESFSVDTLILDEVDSGIGGQVAISVSEMLSCISKATQLICISHLAPIAGAADAHFVVTKSPSEKETLVKINKISLKERESEIARMISGDGSLTNSLALARDILEKNNGQVLRNN
ncbi:MAG: DNA repair protein RecN [Pseudomonadota bacterium]